MSKKKRADGNAPASTVFGERFARIQIATKTRTQTELADLLDIRQSSISDAKRRHSIPPDWILKLLEDHRINPEWIKNGTGPMLLPDDGTVHRNSKIDLSTVRLESLIESVIIKIAPEELKDDIQRTFCIKYFSMNPSDTVSDILNRILPGNIASRVCANFQNQLLLEGGGEATGGDKNDDTGEK